MDTGFLPPDPLLIGIITGGLIALLLFFAFRSGILGVRIPKTGPALATAALFALGIGEMTTFLLLGEETMASAFAVVYLLAGTVLAAFVWKSGYMSRKIAVATVAMSALFGFAVLAPLMPLEFVGLVSIVTSGQTLAPGIVGDPGRGRARALRWQDLLRPSLPGRLGTRARSDPAREKDSYKKDTGPLKASGWVSLSQPLQVPFITST